MDRAAKAPLSALLALAFAAAFLVLAAAPARAHAEFVSSVPAPYDLYFLVYPAQVSVTVSEAVQPGSQSITVTNLTGVRVDSGPTILSLTDPATFSVKTPNLTSSVFTVTWSVISADDGHFSAGSFYFLIRNPDGSLPGPFPQTGGLGPEPISPADAVLQGLDFLGFSILFGTVFLVALVWSPSRADLEGEAAARAEEGERALLQFARLGAILFTAAVAVRFVSTAVTGHATTLDAIAGSPFLLSLLVRIGLGASMAILVSGVNLGTLGASSRVRLDHVVVLGLGLAAILADSFTTHSATLTAFWPMPPVVDAMHLYGAAIWTGGLLALVRGRRWLGPGASPEFVRIVVLAFSRIAVMAVGLLVLAGIILAALLVGSLYNLVTTAYGWIVLAKVALLAPMLLLAWFNRRTLNPPPSDEGTPRTLAVVVGRVRGEAVLGVAVLLVAGLLSTVNPAGLPPSNPVFTLSSEAGGLYAVFQVFPFPETPGNYTFTLEAWLASNGSQYIGAGPSNNSLRFTLVGSSAPPVAIPLEGPHGPNHFFAVSTVMDAPGTWAIEAHLQLVNGTAVDFPYRVVLHP